MYYSRNIIALINYITQTNILEQMFRFFSPFPLTFKASLWNLQSSHPTLESTSDYDPDKREVHQNQFGWEALYNLFTLINTANLTGTYSLT